MLALRLLRLSTVTFGAAATLACAPPSAARAQNAAALDARAARTIASAPDQFFTFGDVRLRYREVGRGDAVVLLHGMARNLEDWIGLGDSLAVDHRVIALDQRGFGKSSRFAEPRRFGVELAEDVVRLLDHLRIQRAHLVGHSMGARVAAAAAARHPDRVESVTLIGGPFSGDTTAFARDEMGLIADIQSGVGFRRFLRWLLPTLPDSLVIAFSDQAMATNDPSTLVAVMRAQDALTVLPEQGKTLRAPALVAAGSGDPLLPQGRWLASWWPRAQLLEVQGADHLTVLYHPRLLAAMRTHIQ